MSTMLTSGKSDQHIQDVLGCGPFQVIVLILVMFVTKAAPVFTMMFMSFGNVNPGWRCLDSKVSTEINDFSLNSSFHGEYIKDNCSLFESCQNVEFAPGVSTIVSEWGLLCDKAWITSAIISLQMAGLLVGCSLVGYLGDAFGRKTVIYGSQALLIILNFVSILSTSWEMFATLRFLIGMTLGAILSLGFVYAAELITMKWRGLIGTIPYWSTKCIFFAVTCMRIKDWRHIHIVITIIGVIGLLPVFWLPESLRWLQVKKETIKFENAIKKMATLNGKTVEALKDSRCEMNSSEEDSCNPPKVYNLLHLLRRGYRMYTVLLTIPWFSMSLIFYAIDFGVKALSGNFYINLIILYAIDIPFSILPLFASNLLGRKKFCFLFSGVSGICLLVSACFQRLATGELQTTGVVVCVILGRLCISSFWGMITLYTTEVYPTVVRGLATSWGNTMARVGGIVAPFLIPNEPSMFFVCYCVMGVLAIICCAVLIPIPETRGKALRETFEQRVDSTTDVDCTVT